MCACRCRHKIEQVEANRLTRRLICLRVIRHAYTQTYTRPQKRVNNCIATQSTGVTSSPGNWELWVCGYNWYKLYTAGEMSIEPITYIIIRIIIATTTTISLHPALAIINIIFVERVKNEGTEQFSTNSSPSGLDGHAVIIDQAGPTSCLITIVSGNFIYAVKVL
uniref:Uncharacterized protein n=1 Tax=Anopheles culicifacies TaxID=139723 RepID=A0A182MLB0_9DIPT